MQKEGWRFLGDEEGTRPENAKARSFQKSAGFNGLPPPLSCVQVSGSVRDRLTFPSTTLMLTAHDLFGSGGGIGGSAQRDRETE